MSPVSEHVLNGIDLFKDKQTKNSMSSNTLKIEEREYEKQKRTFNFSIFAVSIREDTRLRRFQNFLLLSKQLIIPA